MDQHPGQPRIPEVVARALLNIIVYDKCCRGGDTVGFDELIMIYEKNGWELSRFVMARTYAAAQGWIVIEGKSLRLTTAGLAAA
jgi:hypothetical protein